MSTSLIPVILSGGSGTRLWPKSRKHYPKQLLRLTGPHSMLQETALRVKGFTDLIVVCNEDQRFMVAEQLDEVGINKPTIMLEPLAKNTAPAIAVAALQALSMEADPVLAILPADHLIKDSEEFHRALSQAAKVASDGGLVTFGVKPTAPETGYGYIYAPKSDINGNAVVEQFVEKPDLDKAEALVKGGEHFWNSGMFVFKASVFLAELEKFAPDILLACKKSFAASTRDLDFIRLEKEAFASCPDNSIDYAVMEKSKAAWMVPLSSDWNDIGSWSALWDISDKDHNDNVRHGDIVLEDCSNCLFESENRLIAGLGLSNLVVVDTPDAVLVAHKDRVQDVKKLVDKLKESGRGEHLLHREVHRPWGSYDSVDAGYRYQVKRITVKPGGSLSLQMHHHRAEHWIIVSGTALVQRGEEEHLLAENQSIYIPLGDKHRLTNPGKLPLHLIEVQSGSYLGEDDIVRFEDVYGRSI